MNNKEYFVGVYSVDNLLPFTLFMVSAILGWSLMRGLSLNLKANIGTVSETQEFPSFWTTVRWVNGCEVFESDAFKKNGVL